MLRWPQTCAACRRIAPRDAIRTRGGARYCNDRADCRLAALRIILIARLKLRQDAGEARAS